MLQAPSPIAWNCPRAALACLQTISLTEQVEAGLLEVRTRMRTEKSPGPNAEVRPQLQVLEVINWMQA